MSIRTCGASQIGVRLARDTAGALDSRRKTTHDSGQPVVRLSIIIAGVIAVTAHVH
jgi:hypothetical protein